MKDFGIFNNNVFIREYKIPYTPKGYKYTIYRYYYIFKCAVSSCNNEIKVRAGDWSIRNNGSGKCINCNPRKNRLRVCTIILPKTMVDQVKRTH